MYQWADVYRDTLAFLKIGTKEDWMSIPSSGSRLSLIHILRELDEWSWKGYAEKLAAKGYELYLRKDKKGVIRGYVLHKGSSRFKGSELGKGRHLTASRIERTWEKLHPEQTKQESPTPKQPVITCLLYTSLSLNNEQTKILSGSAGCAFCIFR